MASYVSQLIAPTRTMRAVTREFDKQYNRLRSLATVAHEEAAQALLMVHRRHMSGYCAAMGTATFYRSHCRLGLADRVPIHHQEDAPNDRIWKDIQKFYRLFDEPFNQRFGHDYDPIRVELQPQYPFLKINRHW